VFSDGGFWNNDNNNIFVVQVEGMVKDERIPVRPSGFTIDKAKEKVSSLS
jgi:hypothetical protein